MLGAILRLLAAQQGGRLLRERVERLVKKYIILALASLMFMVAFIFVMLAIFWDLLANHYNPINAALIMACLFAVIGFVMYLFAFGHSEKIAKSASKYARGSSHANPLGLDALQDQLPNMDVAGKKIEAAVREYGPLRVATAAVLGGIAIGYLTKRLR